MTTEQATWYQRRFLRFLERWGCLYRYTYFSEPWKGSALKKYLSSRCQQDER